MNLVNELQISAEQDDVLTVLRKTKRLASKLDREDIVGWLQAELTGYDAGKDVPSYRVIGSSIAYNTNGYIPAGFGYVKSGIEDLPFFGNFETPLTESISAVLTMIEELKAGQKAGIFLNVEGNIDQLIRSHLQIHPAYAQQITFLMRLSKTQIMAIPDQIKDKVLDWACALEKAGVHGEGMSFQEEEKRLAHSVTFNLNNCSIEQLNSRGDNKKI